MYFKLHVKIKFKKILKLRASVNMAARDTKTSGLGETGMEKCLPKYDYMCFQIRETWLFENECQSFQLLQRATQAVRLKNSGAESLRDRETGRKFQNQLILWF